ncbi:Proteasome assembly chaperone 2 [Bulinus truncatus]|nr:Proteasome assembly chaperone 2 [Bulinus truncatus]
MFISYCQNSHSFKNCTLILPCVSVGNVGQLATDLLISTYSMERAGYILHPSLLPCVGNNPFESGGQNINQITTCCEVYQKTDLNVVIIQQRAPCIKGKRKEFADWLVSWIKENQFDQVVILTSSFAHERIDQQLSGPPFRILLTNKMNELSGSYLKNQLSLKELERRHTFPAPSPLQLNDTTTDSNVLYMPGSGIIKHLFDNCQDMAVLVLLMFVSEGDNAGDALALSDHLSQCLKLGPPQETTKDKSNEGRISWKIPTSWQLVFGSRFDPILYQ